MRFWNLQSRLGYRSQYAHECSIVKGVLKLAENVLKFVDNQNMYSTKQIVTGTEIFMPMKEETFGKAYNYVINFLNYITYKKQDKVFLISKNFTAELK